MTTTAPSPALEVYLQHPLDDGEALLLLDGSVCLELLRPPGGPSLLDPALRTAARACSTVLLAVARPGRRARAADLLLWTEVFEAVDGVDVELLPLVVLPAAAP